MNSSDYMRRLTLIDLQNEVPPEAEPDFTLQSEFPHVEITRSVEATPEEAYRNGLSEGEARGRAAALKDIEPVLEELRGITSALASARAQRLQDAEAQLAQIGADAARRILHGELAQSEDVVLRMARTCIEEAKNEGPLTLYVAPADAELVRTHLPEFELELVEGGIEVRSEPALSSGSVVLETPTRCYDGRPARILEAAIRGIPEEESNGET